MLKKFWDTSLHGSYYTSKSIKNGAIYFHNNSGFDATFLEALVTPINEAFSLAINNKDFEWIKKFNQYNRNLNKRIPEVKAYTLSDREIEIMKTEVDKNASIEELMSLKYINFDILDLNGLLNNEFNIKQDDDANELKMKIQKINELMPFIESHYVSPYELLISSLNNNKELFKFAIDLQYKELENAVIDNNKELIIKIVSDLFLPPKDIYRTFLIEKENEKKYYHTIYKNDDTKNAEIVLKEKIYNAQCRANNMFIKEKIDQYGRHLKENVYKTLLMLQVDNLPIDDYYYDLTIDSIKQHKKMMFNNAIKNLEDTLEEITKEKAIEKKYNKISSELTKEYLISELNRGEKDKVIVLLCNKLQTILEYKYNYSGDLFTMIDTFIDERIKTHNFEKAIDIIDDNNQEKDELINNRIQLLNKLRMKRNCIVHAEIKEVDMSIQEIIEAVELVEMIDK